VPARGLTIRAYVALWVGSVLLAFVVLLATWRSTQVELRAMRREIVDAAHALDLGRLLETALLREEREDLLWRTTGKPVHRQRRLAALEEAETVAASLHTADASPAERKLVEQIRAKLRLFLAEARADDTPTMRRERPEADDALTLVTQYMRLNDADLQETTRAALRLRRVVDYSFIAVGLLVAVVLAVGSIGLMRRIARPVSELARAARRFGSGDFEARARPARDDELGELCHTFNAMAADLAAQEKARLEFVATVAHDLKNPLVTIGAAARRLRRGGLDPQRQANWLDTIVKQTRRLENLTHDLMDRVQVSAGRLTLNKGPFDLAAALRELIGDHAEAFPRHKLVLEGDDRCPVVGDRDRLERVAINLISNAAKYSPEGSTVRIQVRCRGDRAVLVVQDEGAGMSPDDLRVLFLPFGRGPRAPRMAKGAGLGMCVVKQILEAHDGTISVRSEQGKGTTVEITLPLARP